MDYSPHLVLGKPSEKFINVAISVMGLKANEVATVREDVSTVF